MNDLISLSCINCGGALEITGRDKFFCSYCGFKHIMKRGNDGNVTISEGVDEIKSNTDRTASELAIVRLNRDMPDLINETQRLLTLALEMDLDNVTRSLIQACGRRYSSVINMDSSIAYASKGDIDINALIADYHARIDRGWLNLNQERKRGTYKVLLEMQEANDIRLAAQEELRKHEELVKYRSNEMKMHVGYCEIIREYEDDFIIFGVAMLDPWTGIQYTSECTAYKPLPWKHGIREHPSYYIQNGSEPLLHEYAFGFNNASDVYEHMKSTVSQWARVLNDEFEENK